MRTPRGTIRADVVVRATEAFTPTLPGLQRALVPVYSLMIATEPLPDAFWAEAGLHERETFTDARRLVIYGQRTADGRFAFGGRGAPYHLGSRDPPAVRRGPRRVRRAAAHAAVAVPGARRRRGHPPLGRRGRRPRDWYSSVGFDRATGMGWAGGYVGDGVCTTNLAGRTLADLVLGRDTDITHLPWVGHVSPQWEPEPLRWLGINGTRMLVTSLDRAEAKGEIRAGGPRSRRACSVPERAQSKFGMGGSRRSRSAA